MKKRIIILGLGFLSVFCLKSQASVNNYSPYYPYRTSIYQNGCCYPSTRYTGYNNMNYPYCAARTYNSHYCDLYNVYNMNTSNRRQLRRIKKIQRKLKNNVSWFNNNNGTMTGYSVPVSKNILNNFPNKKIQPLPSSPTCNTELWGSGSSDSQQGNYGIFPFKNTNETKTGSKTGVTIIYD